MVFIVGLILMCVLVWLFADQIKKYPAYFYAGAFILTVISYIVYKNVTMPEFVKTYLLGIFTTGTLGIAGFYIVMFTGALRNGSPLIKKLMMIRGELSILSCILMFAHLAIFGPSYIGMAAKNASVMSKSLLVSIICGTVLLVQMTYLGVTSVKVIRRKFKAKTWKKLQRTAYLFYFLTYVHGVTMQATKIKSADKSALVTIIAYSILFFTYVIMRVRKALLAKYKKADALKVAKFDKIGTSIAGVLAVALLCLITIPQFSEYAEASERIEARKKEAAELQAMLDALEEDEEVAADSAENVTGVAEENASEVASSSDEASSENASTTVDSSNASSSNSASTNTSGSASASAGSTGSSSSGSSTGSSGSSSAASSSAGSSSASQGSSSSTGSAQAEATRTYKADGSYSASATVEDYAYPIVVTITISNDKIVSATANISAASDLDYDFAEMAAGGLSASGYSAVSGATYSSAAIQKAYDAAVAKAKN
ncbi:ferric reductase-like transmembrane domain-containing protein [Lachnospira sp.]|jgi:DMSO/TMAO reductase YedYZ heme-binding membrane subunit/Tfp pilus assembly protein PilE|uniref:ferric reductase-like transmembrane domain-containing protein n=1 Tax=Lachnospira sp. TaxID=2049031 RepID=UPI0025803DE0|nr:ferric reductase-like transmembrane domain-containing protein [Lachnospira sp.]